MPARTYVHINRHKLVKNSRTGTREPVIAIKTYKGSQYANLAVIRDAHGNAVAQVVYRPDKPLNCGAVAWVESIPPGSITPG